MTAAFKPVVILGVPRSGTTLLRALLGAHSEIAGLPETPWLLGAYGDQSSVRGLLSGLIDNPMGLIKNVSGADEQDVWEAGQAFLEALFQSYLSRMNKNIVVLKTPGDIQHLDFLMRLLPEATYVHICRDERDVALSYLAKKGSFFARHTARGHMDFSALLQRWYEWESKIRDTLVQTKRRHVSLSYEDLITKPENEIRRICEFIGVAFEPSMLRYTEAKIDLPAWEAGSTDVRQHAEIVASKVQSWKQIQPTPSMAYALMHYDEYLVRLGYESSNLDLSWMQLLAARTYEWWSPIVSAVDRLADVSDRVKRHLIPV